MNRFKRHKVKREKPEPSTSHSREAEEHDLAYYIHDRVELMHQVFSVLKHKELRTMAPECVRRISIDDLQELCTEELLGISSKRLCAILDGAEPPSDTESSSQSEPEQMETISLDSISSDEEILSQTSSKKKKHKHRRRDSKAKSKKKTKSKEPDDDEDTEKSKASRAGLTVLELLELQARARAIRAQLQQEQANKQAAEPAAAVDQQSSASENEVEIKEEPPEVVEISSDEEKPKIEKLEKALAKANNANKIGLELANNISEKDKEVNKSKEKKSKKEKSKKDKKKDKENKRKDSEKANNDPRQTIEKTKSPSPEVVHIEVENTNKHTENKVTKKINDLIITVPKQHSRKIKLNRSKVTISVGKIESVANSENSNRSVSAISPEKTTSVINNPTEMTEKSTIQRKDKDKSKKKQKKKERKKSSDKDASDQDEITLQLSDSEKMDLLEGFDRRNLDNVTSSSEDSDSSSDSDSDSSEDSSKQNSFVANQSTTVEKNDDNSLISNVNMDDLDNNGKNEVIGLEYDKNNLQNKGAASKEVFIRNEHFNTCANGNEEEKTDYNLKGQNETQTESYYGAQESNNDQTITTEKNDTLNKIEGFISSNGNDQNIESNDIYDIPVRDDTTEYKDSQTNKESENITGIDEKSSKNHSENIERKKYFELSQKSAENIEEHTQNIEQETSIQLSQKSSKNIEQESVECTDKVDTEMKSNDKSQDKLETEIDSYDYCQDKVNTNNENSQDINKNLSEGEISSNESSEVEACELKAEVVCISDEEADSNKVPKKKKHKKKEKKSKKVKKVKKSTSDFREVADQNFYREIHIIDKDEDDKVTSDNKEYVSIVDDDDVYEILELSDDSSCYEVEGTVLSKEPTAEEIEALSAKIDEIEREEIITEEQIREHERELIKKRTINENNTENEGNSEDNIENISWKDRYLGSKKVKTVLNTSNILNALRKKNKELKKKLEESKKKEEQQIVQQNETPEENKELELGSIEHYNTLQGSTTYVNPVQDITDDKEIDRSENVIIDLNNTEIQVTGEMKKDAKQLLKMYKKLLKYNDMTKPKDPNKKKKKKQKKKEKDAGNVASSDVVSQ